MWINKSNVEMLYTPKKKGFRKAAFETVKKYAIKIAKKNDAFRKMSRKILLNSGLKSYEQIKASTKTDEKVILFSTFGYKFSYFNLIHISLPPSSEL